MGHGMADFLDKKVDTLEDWDLYCHYVAGLVGHGLTRLMGLSGLEGKYYFSIRLTGLLMYNIFIDPSLAENLEL
jgi:phytoene/squalene synthetase